VAAAGAGDGEGRMWRARLRHDWAAACAGSVGDTFMVE